MLLQFTGAVLATALQGPTAPIAPVTVVTHPDPLVRGTVGLVVVRPAAAEQRRLAGLRGSAAGEPLHFEPTEGGAYRAVIGVPIEGPDSLAVSLMPSWADSAADSLTVVLRVAGGTYRVERLTVVEKYVKPDSAAAARIEEEIARAREISRHSHETPRLWFRPFRVPRPGRVTSPFGSAREFNGEVESRHLGTDFAGAVGAPVRAANDGVVALVAEFYLAGNVVYLDHGAGLVTGYFHLSRTAVAVGDTVRQGQLIGRVGRSGRVTGPHLHWIARYGGITVDATSLLALPPGRPRTPPQAAIPAAEQPT
jgi:murein DD-endopeptidase MepM/ murein hydrolase activator NlpD